MKKKLEVNKLLEKKLPSSIAGVDFKVNYRGGMNLIGNNSKVHHRLMVGIPVTGLVRVEWMMARFGQIHPCNWSQTDAIQWLDQYSPIDFLVADARNIIVHFVIEQNFDWLFFIDHDTVLHPMTVFKLNERMIKGNVPMWSGLYFTKSVPSEPLVYRGNGTGYYNKWKFGDQVWVDGIPMGCTMIHNSILRAMADESEVYEPRKGMLVKKVFSTPSKVWYDPESRTWFTATGTEDLKFCADIVEKDIFKKAGWPAYSKKKYPFLIDTSIYCKHIDEAGIQYPANGEDREFLPTK
jgi:hypothetical protein